MLGAFYENFITIVVNQIISQILSYLVPAINGFFDIFFFDDDVHLEN